MARNMHSCVHTLDADKLPPSLVHSRRGKSQPILQFNYRLNNLIQTNTFHWTSIKLLLDVKFFLDVRVPKLRLKIDVFWTIMTYGGVYLYLPVLLHCNEISFNGMQLNGCVHRCTYWWAIQRSLTFRSQDSMKTPHTCNSVFDIHIVRSGFWNIDVEIPYIILQFK